MKSSLIEILNFFDWMLLLNYSHLVSLTMLEKLAGFSTKNGRVSIFKTYRDIVSHDEFCSTDG